ncbi:hypothetical protein ABT336_12055 [Micromonospora sp. NPDC000207]|uniref:hypothetical protein n=1 Tax=Micromonospora sp. NPDC000207 TaxID=3154246 RepID=UPI00333097DD
MQATAAKPLSYTVQNRTDSGWKRVRGYTTETAALRCLQRANNAGTYRVIACFAGGAFEIVALRCPAS